MGKMTNAYRIFVGILEGKRPLGRATNNEGIILQLIINNHCVRF
jgi:hypothetical protein